MERAVLNFNIGQECEIDFNFIIYVQKDLVHVNTAVQQLPEPDMVVDPRPIDTDGHYVHQVIPAFKLIVKGTHGTDNPKDQSLPKERNLHFNVLATGWQYEVRFPVYLRNEFRYSFESTKYLYQGLHGEVVPKDATEVIVKDGVKIIIRGAFDGCEFLVKVTICDKI